MALGIPLKLLHESEGFVVTVELKNNEIYRGHLVQGEDNMNMELINVTLVSTNGQSSTLEKVYIRGSLVKFIVTPSFLENSPIFFTSKEGKGKGEGLRRAGLERGGGRGRGRGRMRNMRKN
ncbi:small nuclear ribonucleoprotein sm d3 [Anaeramoeba flamelloides]|uniref:Small nuclear ribonucleoprotein Sm D3 n=1 Tax=Anaeramoeba flamelloides TaxID=1746091 RepID=A0AAV7ZWT8_9EUKA|nr:small nuclear ribonucleoprotein sm d3 [Anaeramoeba flamelloides]KAJ3445072.1 small nuclear ribonucleoprotein sm d3 [Anaeramoeba flamelloides]KAJ3451694.1 small nuclear ribonucleoprotein sm d3 [Anaeramoeba flamelloides]KAJ6238942.1 small nuclear ribonucleoprotein sm d3 [Anaeramoeba flamelloides]KAJ6248415.1 small nuclear ribonucleoprotein sm d3 [Anaeramoeba flamelloides]